MKKTAPVVAALALLAAQGAACALPAHLAFCSLRPSGGPASRPWDKGGSCFAQRHRVRVSMQSQSRDNTGGAESVESFGQEPRRAVLRLTGVYGLVLIGSRVAQFPCSMDADDLILLFSSQVNRTLPSPMRRYKQTSLHESARSW